MNALVPFIMNLRKSEKGATAVEYGLMVAAIAAVIIIAVVAIGGALNDVFEFVQAQLEALVP